MKTLLSILLLSAWSVTAQSINSVVSIPTVTVSATPGTLPNDGKMFGPNTLGTKTSGLQEAVNSYPQAIYGNATSGGGEILLSRGVFNLVDTVWLTNSIAARGLTFRGAGKDNTIIKLSAAKPYAFSTTTNSYPAPGSSSLNIVFQDLTICTDVTNSPVTLVNLQALNEARFVNCLIAQAQAITNVGAELNYIPVNCSNYTTGIFTFGDNAVNLYDTAIWATHIGWKSQSDHNHAVNLLIDGCDDNASLTNVWVDPNSGCVIPKSAGVICETGDMTLINTLWDNGQAPIVSAAFVQNIFPLFGDNQSKGLVCLTGTIQNILPNPAADGGYSDDIYSVDSSGVWHRVTNGQAVSFFSDHNGLFTLADNGSQVQIGDTNIISVFGAGTNNANGTYWKCQTNALVSGGDQYPMWTNTASPYIIVFDGARADFPDAYCIVESQAAAFIAETSYTAPSILGPWTASDPEWGTAPNSYFGSNSKSNVLSVVGNAALQRVTLASAVVGSGSGAPTASNPNGSIYLRTDGAGGFYVRTNGAWSLVK